MTTERPVVSPAYDMVMLTLSLFAIGALAARTVAKLQPETLGVLEYADTAICIPFFVDFLWSVWRARDRARYLMTWGWLDLLSSIPSIDVLRWGRLARVLRILRVLRGVRASSFLALLVLRRRAQNVFLAASLVAAMLIVLCSIAVLHFETGPTSNIRTAEEALWWAFSTITTVGYGDHYPLTTEGRIVAVTLMCAGVGLFGTFSGFLASWFLSSDQSADSDTQAIRRELAAIRVALASISNTQRSQHPISPSEAQIAPPRQSDPASL